MSSLRWHRNDISRGGGGVLEKYRLWKSRRGETRVEEGGKGKSRAEMLRGREGDDEGEGEREGGGGGGREGERERERI